jgi:hypothetical protein
VCRNGTARALILLADLASSRNPAWFCIVWPWP